MSKNKERPSVLIGTTSHLGLELAKLHQKLRMGNVICTRPEPDKQKALEFAKYARQEYFSSKFLDEPDVTYPK